jgi:MoxR-like ATPase
VENLESNLPENENSNQESGLPAAQEESSPISSAQRVNVSKIAEAADKIQLNLAHVVIGQEKELELILAALLTGGHVLLEGLPGIAKTLIAKSIARSISSDFNRIQFTPDLMPSDITGTSVFNLKDAEFVFRKGPIFANIVLIDEVNRAPAKTQAALMEVMEEKQITYDGITYKMGKPFFVIATQNPIEQEGTYALPEAQLDRFLFRIKMSYPSLENEIRILQTYSQDFRSEQPNNLHAVLSKEAIDEAISIIEKVHLKDELLRYIAAIVDRTRISGDLFLGASPRASLGILKSSKAIAAIRGRDFVTPDDIKDVAIAVLNHRVILAHEREMEGVPVEDVLKNIVASVEVPR